MSRRRWWTAGATLIMLPILALSIAIALVDPNNYKPVLIDAVQDATGRTLNLNGPLRLTRSLWPTIEASDVSFTNLPGGTRPDMARAERIEVALSLPALLWHRVEVTRLTLIGPDILFEQVNGISNWVFEPPGRPGSAPLVTPATPFELRVRTVHVQNGMVTWRLPARTKVVGLRSLDLHHHTDDAPLNLDAIMVYSDNQPFSFRASARQTAGLSDPWMTQLDFSAFDTVASAVGTMDLAGHFDLQVEARSGSLEKLNALLPEMRLPAMQRATLSTHLTNGPVPGDLPVVGATRLQFASADGGDRAPRLKLDAFDVSVPEPGGSATVAGTGRFKGQPFTLSGTVGVPLHPDGRGALPLDMKVMAAPDHGKSASGSLSLKGHVMLDTLSFHGLDAAATLHTPSLAALRPILSPRLPALSNVQFDGHLTIPASPDWVAFSGAKLLSDAGDVSGNGKVGVGGHLSLSAKLHSSKLDMDAMLTAFGIRSVPPAPRGSTTGPVISSTPLPWDAFRGPSIDATGGIDSLTFHNQVWSGVELGVRLKDGSLREGTVKLNLPDGPLTLSATADAAVEAVPVSLSVQAPGVPLALIAHYAGLPGQVTGSARVDARLSGQGSSMNHLAASLDGPVSLTVMGGQLSNAVLVDLASASLEALGVKVPPQGETALRCLGIVGSFSKGLGEFRTIVLETTYLSLKGVGLVDLVNERVGFKLNPVAQVSGSPVSVPVVVEGPFRAITGRLDATGLEKLGLLFNAWFGSVQQTACVDAGLASGHKSKP
jgi:uncharacterized protein involved in outer membrane biogenesis